MPNSNVSLSVFGTCPDPGLVAVEIDPAASQHPATATLYVRDAKGQTLRIQEPFTPFFWVDNADSLSGCPVPVEHRPLAGLNPLQGLAVFQSWPDWGKAKAWLTQKTGFSAGAADAPFLLINDPVQQHLMMTGRTLFKGLAFEQIRRMQVDIETHTEPGFEFCNADREADAITIIAMGDSTGWAEILINRDGNEKRLLETFVQRVQERDPDVIEGHNSFRFDWPYIMTRAKRHGVKLALGRDKSRAAASPSRFATVDQTLNFQKVEIHGRHIVDTFFLLKAYDVSHRALDGFGLKEAARHFKLSPPGRVYIEGAEIAKVFTQDPDRVAAYAADDIRETAALAALLSRPYFVQAQLVPFSYQAVCLRGNASKIDALLLREYLRLGQAVPQPDAPREFSGGYSDIFERGVIPNIHHCDVRSLYPSLMLAQGIAPARDDRGVFLGLLRYLRDLRVEAKARMRTVTDSADKADAEALQACFKILINSFYGYLGFAQARFSDFDAAERVTTAGRAVLSSMIEWLRCHGARPIEIDTDGIYFVPPSFSTPKDLAAFRQALDHALPPGIEIEFDGEYVAMLSYKIKNYALLEASGEVILKGAALKSRGLEPYLREYLRESIRLRLEGRDRDLPALKARYVKTIQNRECPIAWLAKTETLKDAPETYAAKIAKAGRGRNAAYELALSSDRSYQAGDPITYYITGSRRTVAAYQAARQIAQWNVEARDENIAYYLAKLDALDARLASGESEDDV